MVQSGLFYLSYSFKINPDILRFMPTNVLEIPDTATIATPIPDTAATASLPYSEYQVSLPCNNALIALYSNDPGTNGIIAGNNITVTGVRIILAPTSDIPHVRIADIKYIRKLLS